MKLFVLSLCLTCVFSAPTDFQDTIQDYEFIYHDLENLLLVVDQDTCYYVYMPDSNEAWTRLTSRRLIAEAAILSYIEGRYVPSDEQPEETAEESAVKLFATEEDLERPARASVMVSHTTLDLMRDKFEDRLADYHCFDKNVYEAQLPMYFWTGDGDNDGGDSDFDGEEEEEE